MIAGRPKPPRTYGTFRRDDMRPLLFGVGCGFSSAVGEEFGQGLSFTARRHAPTASTSTRRSGSGSQPVPSSSRSASGHVAFLEVVDELYRLLALRLPHGFENTRLGDPAEIVVGGRPPAHCYHVESDGAGEDGRHDRAFAGRYERSTGRHCSGCPPSTSAIDTARVAGVADIIPDLLLTRLVGRNREGDELVLERHAIVGINLMELRGHRCQTQALLTIAGETKCRAAISSSLMPPSRSS